MGTKSNTVIYDEYFDADLNAGVQILKIGRAHV
jgi:hypothetical protein